MVVGMPAIRHGRTVFCTEPEYVPPKTDFHAQKAPGSVDKGDNVIDTYQVFTILGRRPNEAGTV